MSYYWGRAFNPLTREWMEKPKRPSIFDYSHVSEWLPAHYQYISDMKKWEAFIAELPATYVYKRPKLVHATEKGVPVPHLRDGKRRKYVNGAGVSANSRILPHRYADEGEKGSGHRREIRRKERAQWLSEWQQEEREAYDAYDAETVAQWFYDNTDDVDFDVIPSVYTVGETVVEWSSDYYDDYGYVETYGCGDPYCDICGTGYDTYEDDDWCAHCGGPCEL